MGPLGLLLALALHLVVCTHPHRDYCVLGAGPAGLQMAALLQQAGRDYEVFERESAPGSFFTRYPRHRKLISINKRHTGKANAEFNLRHDWNSLLSDDPHLLFKHYSKSYFPDASDMVHYLGDFAKCLGLRVLYNTNITHVALNKDPHAWNGHYFILTDQNSQAYQCSVLLVATGLSVPKLVDFPGSEHVEGYESVSVDPEDFVGQNVLILGRGNSAFETAENILGVTNFVHMLSRSRVRLSWATHYVGDVRSLRLSSGTEFSKKYPLIRASYESKGSRGLFILGTASHSVDYRKSAGGFIHGFRYTVRAVHRLLEHRHHGISWPSTEHPITQLTSSIIRRVNEASGLYQMFSVLADIILLKEDATAFEYLEEFPMQMLAQLETLTGRTARHGLFVINMEYGKNFSGPEKDVFYYDRSVAHIEDAWRSNFLHPVIYYYRHLPTEQDMRFRPAQWPLPRPIAIHHIVEDFLTDWTAPVGHILPLRRFLENCLDTDLRSFYAESCFLFTLTRQRLPPFCQQGYLKMQGLSSTKSLQQHGVESRLLQDYTSMNDSSRWLGNHPSAGQSLDSNKEEL
ncbi:FAD-dependent oxidoreductase domain-containing protein 2 isoform X2 [Phodopus roborovskii]|uniref:FAD-dependent oxidoreductase domain-containing protein 2 isoform X2 n=1 Tax=Phodopus roborovskii TaxID=109678 RepID=UPI0021E3E05C|nr:FAD-dependent oxidoreductase domain-containing protein 2 isoform X2 [Phodopus roborovskii]